MNTRLPLILRTRGEGSGVFGVGVFGDIPVLDNMSTTHLPKDLEMANHTVSNLSIIHFYNLLRLLRDASPHSSPTFSSVSGNSVSMLQPVALHNTGSHFLTPL